MNFSALIGALLLAVCAFPADERQVAPNLAPRADVPQKQTYEFHALKPRAAKSLEQFLRQAPASVVVQSPFCFKMRTFQVKSDPNRWDVTTPSGYSECLVASKVRLKGADGMKNR